MNKDKYTYLIISTEEREVYGSNDADELQDLYEEDDIVIIRPDTNRLLTGEAPEPIVPIRLADLKLDINEAFDYYIIDCSTNKIVGTDYCNEAVDHCDFNSILIVTENCTWTTLNSHYDEEDEESAAISMEAQPIQRWTR